MGATRTLSRDSAVGEQRSPARTVMLPLLPGARCDEASRHENRGSPQRRSHRSPRGAIEVPVLVRDGRVVGELDCEALGESCADAQRVIDVFGGGDDEAEQ